MQRIILKQSDKKILSQYSENQKPNEACGILFGKNNQVLDIFLTENKDESPVNFTISNEQLIEGYKIAHASFGSSLQVWSKRIFFCNFERIIFCKSTLR